MKPQQQYVGLDVSLEQTSVCVVDDAGTTIWRGKCSSTPEGIHAVVAKHAPEAVRALKVGDVVAGAHVCLSIVIHVDKPYRAVIFWLAPITSI